MTTVQTVGAVSGAVAEWLAIDWQSVNRNVRRLQVRIVQAWKAGRWNKVKALQRLLTCSYSGKVLAVRRVTENTGKKTPGVDQEIWDTPEKKTQAVQELIEAINLSLYDVFTSRNRSAKRCARSESPP